MPWKHLALVFSFPWVLFFVFIPLDICAGLSIFFWNGQSWVSEPWGSVIRGGGSKPGTSGIGVPHAWGFWLSIFCQLSFRSSLLPHSGPSVKRSEKPWLQLGEPDLDTDWPDGHVFLEHTGLLLFVFPSCLFYVAHQEMRTLEPQADTWHALSPL